MARLEHISNELFEMVVALLDFKTICSLRLVSHDISAKTNQNTFQSFFQTVRVPVTLDSLEAFERATSGFLGHCIKNLILVGIVYDLLPLKSYVKRYVEQTRPGAGVQTRSIPKAELSPAERALAVLQEQRAKWTTSQNDGQAAALLRSAFDHISEQSRCLHTLSFHVHTVPKSSQLEKYSSNVHRCLGVPVNEVKAASETLSIGLSGLEGSKLTRINALDIYSSCPPSLWAHFQLGVPIDLLSDILDRKAAALEPLLSGVQRLSIKFADPQIGIPGMFGMDIPADLRADNHAKLMQDGPFFGLTDLLVARRNVEELHISRHSVSPITTCDQDISRYCQYDLISRQMRHLMKHVKLARLRKLRLDGFNMKDDDLAGLLLCFRSSLESLRLVSMDIEGLITTGLAPVTDGRCLLVKRLSLEDLRQNSLDITWHQERQDEAEQPTSEGEEDSPGGEFICRYGKDVRRPILYYLDYESEDDEDDDFPANVAFD